MNILNYINKINEIYGKDEPRNTELAKADIPRHLWDNFNTPDLEQSPDSFLQPGETLEDWDVSFRRPNAEGGVQQLVRNTADGSRPGYNGRGGPRPNTGGDRSMYIDYEIRIKNPGKKKLDIAEKVHGNKPEYKGLKGFELWKKLKTFQRSNITEGHTTSQTSGIGKPKKNMLSKTDFTELVKNNRNKTYNEFVEIIKKYKTKDGTNFTKSIVADRLRDYGLSGSFKKEPPKGTDNIKKAEAEKKRRLLLKETDPTKAKGTKKYPFHHIRQIAGGVPLTTDDVVIINQRMNSVMSQYNKALNRISAAIQKNNKLALEAMNAKNEGAALDYMKRVDKLNAQAEKIVNSAIDKLPKKYKGLVGFNQFTLPTNEYGLPISNEPMIVKKVGGMPISKDAIDLTTLDLNQEKEFKKIVRQQAEAGKTGPIKMSQKQRHKFLGNFWCGTKQSAAGGGRIGFSGSCPVEVKQKNFLRMTNDVANGKITGEAAEQIAKNAGKVVAKVGSKSALATLLGPAGIGVDIIYEVGSVGTDMLMNNVSFKEAMQNNWLTGAFMRGTGEEEYHKGLTKKYSGAKPYARSMDIINRIQDIEGTLATIEADPLTEYAERQDRLQQELESLYKELDVVAKAKGVGPAGQYGKRYTALEHRSPEQIAYDQAKLEYDSGREAKALLKKPSKHGFKESLKSSRAEPWIDFGLSINPQYGKYSKRELDQRLKQFGDYYGYGWTPYGLGYGMQQMKPGIGDMKYNKDLGYRQLAETMADAEATDRIAEAGGISKLAGGGMVGIRRPSALPPTGGPMHQGLRSLYINDKDY